MSPLKAAAPPFFALRYAAPMLTDKVALAANYPKSTMQRTLEDLHAYGVVERGRNGDAINAALTWCLSDWGRGLYDSAACSPEMSDRENY